MIHSDDQDDIDYELWMDFMLIQIGKEFPEHYDKAMLLFPRTIQDCSAYCEAMITMINNFSTSRALDEFQNMFLNKVGAKK